MGEKLFVFNGGFLTQRRTRRILTLAGFKVALGRPPEGGLVGIWGASPTSHRGKAVASHEGANLLRVEDAFLRSVHPGRSGGLGHGLLLDRSGVHFDPARPSDLETLLATAPLDDTALLNRARAAIEQIRLHHLSKYSAFDPTLPPPDPGYVLVIDQTQGDAAVTASGADRGTFLDMLVAAQLEHPDAKILIKSHPETVSGHRAGYFGPEDENARIFLTCAPHSPHLLFEGARAVYTVSSGLGFEAIFAGHKPRVFGQPFYAGWGLTEDENPPARRTRRLTRAQLFAAAMILYPTWYDPYRDTLCEIEDVIAALAAQARAWREDRDGWVASHMRLWKRRPLSAFYGSVKAPLFEDTPEKAKQTGRPHMAWASKSESSDAIRCEDGFLRSKGLGADLIPPLSLVLDDLGIYYDPTRESRLERLIAASPDLPQGALDRAARLRRAITDAAVSKYNVGGARPLLPVGHRILVPGQVEDDASIRLGTQKISTNKALLEAVRDAHPKAVIVYKPHPDVEAGLRPGAIPGTEIAALADVVAHRADPVSLIEACDAVWTMTSLLGFEALLRDTPVTCLGTPFYAGWGLTEDLGDIPARRGGRGITLHGLVHAALIDYPRYYDPVRRLPCPPEVIVARLASGTLPRPGLGLRLLAKAQGALASYAHLWR
ncbi:MAG: capsular polysaccharide biosynthesis protein [Pseudomonadota bacterium]